LKIGRIGVLMGGFSAEREVSLMSGKGVLKALLEKGYQAVPIEVGDDIFKRLMEEKIEVAFIALHGRLGEDGCIQGMLEILRIPYTGSGVLASAIGMNKVFSKRIFEQMGIPVPPYMVIRKKERDKVVIPPTIGIPFVVKPSREGSSVGVSIVRNIAEAENAFTKAFKFGDEIIVEKYIAGREISVAILDDTPLGAIEIRPKGGEFYDYRVKYSDGLAEHILPAPLRPEKYKEALDLSLRAHRALSCEGATRVDLMFDLQENFYVLEVNTIPGMTEISLLPEIARGAGISFPDLVERILLSARLKG
jgi:D-alanine-D-alanine ligase